MKNKKIYVVVAIIIIIVGVGHSRYTDMIDNSDVISFLGSIFGALIGIWGALYVIYKDRNQEKENNIKKLMDMFKHTYMWVYPRHYIGASNSIKSLSDPIVPLIYDEKWKEYVINIDNTHHKRFLLSWFYTLESLENKNEFIAKIGKEQIEEALKILKFYNMYDKEIKDLEDTMNDEELQVIKNEISRLSNEYNKIIDGYIQSSEAVEEEYEMQREEESSYEEQLEIQISKLVREYDQNIVNNSIYKF
ncbi:MAG: hypothetical protein RSG52_04910 [Terrisporobacter sp.]|uniref:hypothetical protein n=1 Tax=Terrisporobacter sp. TaxID=1965305 RepID=UPI002FC72BAC